MTALGQRIKAERKARQITMRELCDRAGLRFTRLGYIESDMDNYGPSDNELRRIAEALGMTVEQLRGGAS